MRRRTLVLVTDWLWNWAFAHQCPTWIRKLAHRLDLAVNPPHRPGSIGSSHE